MFKELFGSEAIEQVMFYILINDKCYAGKLAKNFDIPVVAFQRALKRLERAGVLVNYLEGRTRVYVLNPRYPFKDELVAFFKKSYEYLPDDYKNKYYQKERKRPRRAGKPQ